MEFSPLQDLTNLIGVSLETVGAVSAAVYLMVEAVKRQFGIKGYGTQVVAFLLSGYFALQIINPFELGDWYQFGNLWAVAWLAPTGLHSARKNGKKK